MIGDSQQELLELTRENNKMLKSLRAHNRWATFSHILYWLLIIATAVITFHYIQPYLTALIKAYNSLQGAVNSIPKFQ